MSTKKPSVRDWRNFSADKWTVTTFRAYLFDEHERRYGISYVTRNHAIEGRWLKTLIAEHGAEVVRKFIDACFAEYRPTPQYPGLNFAFMYSYQRARILPRILAEQARRERAQAIAAPITEEEIGWL
ncbi:hypothetical protein [Cytobacillus massiliigabonensis]|uniref:hypothetical protein n=1 Tax=Cytobacillus massiliigabonensis TaxID=1871011 RepID=UPI000C81C4DE|nr:hypothetical protein [Cytobacillus massiliigabonensis]